MAKLIIEYKGFRNSIEAESDWLTISPNRENTCGIQYNRGELADYIKHHRSYLSRGDIGEAVSKFLPTYESVLVDSSDVENDTHFFYIVIREYPNSWEGWLKENIKPVAKDVTEQGVDSGVVGALIYTWEVLEVLGVYQDSITQTIGDYLEETSFNITLTSKDFDSFDGLMTRMLYQAVEIEAQKSIYLEELDNYDCDDDDCDEDEDVYEDDWNEGEDLELIKAGGNDPDTDLFDGID